MRFRRVRLAAPAHALDALSALYGGRIGETELGFAAGEGEPFYHFALLVPGDRFEAALDWIGGLAELLPNREGGEVVFEFEAWNAQACYFHDPAGNIVELIAHRGTGETGARGPFERRELLGVSELGLVGDTRALAAALRDALELPLWSGTVDEAGRLAFVGERARTLILCPPGRGWLPTGRPAELHPADVVLAGAPRRTVVLEEGRYRVSGA